MARHIGHLDPGFWVLSTQEPARPTLTLITQDPSCVHDPLPIEVLSHILHLSTSDLTTGLRSYKCDGYAEWEPYNRALHDCAQFRLVDGTWNAVLTPILYSIFVLPAWPLEKLIHRAKAVDYHPEMIKALIVGTVGDGLWIESSVNGGSIRSLRYSG
ncbi:hypothetical protein BDN72DRAFT_899047 [Pluteus cervinus]|uniref:Uncharacterized protein n=1 Tax=Pluteus cervinus TaxID=181527 RepID=A0ACD3ANW4_9AGAR|nr:hypothetical protein BDN72DRAFT_899047 [Pluteus cervinus]